MKVFKRIVYVLALLLVTGWGYAQFLLATETHTYAPISESQLEEAQAYLDQAIEPIAASWVWETFEPEAGISLRTGRFEDAPANPKGVIIVVPGYTAPLEMIARSINQFHAAGYLVYGFEYRGQGHSTRLLANPEKGHVEDYAIFAGDLAKFADQVRQPALSLNIYAISQGAHITMRMAGDGLGSADRFALVVPMSKILTGDFPYGVSRVLAAALTYVGLGETFAPGRGPWDVAKVTFGSQTECNANPQRAQVRDALFALDETKRVNGPTARWVHESIRSTDRLFSADYAENISAPVIMFTAGQDTIVDTDASVALCNKLGNCTRRHFAEARHCIGLETDAVRDAIIEASLEHFGGE